MGAVKNSSAIYLTIADGKIVRRFKQPTKDTVTRTTKEGKVVHEEIYDGWNGRIAGIEFRDHKDYGRFVNVMINDGEATAILQMKQGSGYAMAFLKTLPNVDLQTDVKLSPSMKVEGDKKKTSMFINQHGEALKWAYTRDQPNGIPELRKIKVKGKETWDDSEVVEFLENMVATQVIPSLQVVATTSAQEDEDGPFS
jgi:hypothetical protein